MEKEADSVGYSAEINIFQDLHMVELEDLSVPKSADSVYKTKDTKKIKFKNKKHKISDDSVYKTKDT